MACDIPVSSSSVRKTNPFAVPGRCRTMTAPAVATRRPFAIRVISFAVTTPSARSFSRKCARRCGPVVSSMAS